MQVDGPVSHLVKMHADVHQPFAELAVEPAGATTCHQERDAIAAPHVAVESPHRGIHVELRPVAHDLATLAAGPGPMFSAMARGPDFD